MNPCALASGGREAGTSPAAMSRGPGRNESGPAPPFPGSPEGGGDPRSPSLLPESLIEIAGGSGSSTGRTGPELVERAWPAGGGETRVGSDATGASRAFGGARGTGRGRRGFGAARSGGGGGGGASRVSVTSRTRRLESRAAGIGTPSRRISARMRPCRARETTAQIPSHAASSRLRPSGMRPPTLLGNSTFRTPQRIRSSISAPGRETRGPLDTGRPGCCPACQRL
jgi:hypothetical protein